MKKIGRIILWTVLVLIVVVVVFIAGFFYKVKNGFPVSYETEKPAITFPEDRPAVLLFSKTTGFRHGEAIDASKPVFSAMAERNNWFVYQTEEGGVFNKEQLEKFSVVIFDNSTGRVLNDEQQIALANYVENGGALIGIHGAGDDSHHWDWYQNNLLGAKFSHHPLNPQFQKADVMLQTPADTAIARNLPAKWTNTDEWYVFFTQPKGVKVLYYIDGDKIIPNGNLLWISDKNFGMGTYQPVAWYRAVGTGKTFYTSMGHSKEVWAKPEFVKLLENAVNWTIK